MDSDVQPSFIHQAQQAAALLKAIANENRLLILCHLVESGELPVGELVERVGLGQSAISQHLAKLRAEGHVSFRKEAQTVFYRVADPRTEKLLHVLHDIFCPTLGQDNVKILRRGVK